MNGSTNFRCAAGLLTAAVVLGSAAPAFGQTLRQGGTFVPMPTSAQQLSTPAQPQTQTATQQQTTGSTTTTDASQLPEPWDQIISLADELAAHFGIEFNDPWEEFFFTLLVARMYFEMQEFNAQMGGTTGGTAPAGTTTTGGTSQTGQTSGTATSGVHR